MTEKEITQCLSQAFPQAQIKVTDLKGDGQYIEISVITPEFAGKTKIAQHRMVMKSLEGKVGTAIHAVTLKTKAP